MKRKRKRNLKYKKSIKKRTPFDGLKVNLLDPVKLNSETKELGQKLDRFYNKYFKQFYKQAPSQILEGAFYAARIECRSNPDWMSQSANSMRELLYPLFIDKSKYKNLLKIFRTYIVDKNLKAKIKSEIFLDTFENLEEIYSKLTDLAHHGTKIKGFKSKKDFLNFSENDFENLMTSFVLILNKTFDLQQIYIHTIINAVLNRKRRTKRLQEELNLILQINFDAKNYFYAKADERWFDWLWKNKFLNVIKQKAKDPTRYGYRTPELRYLVRIAERKPAKVAEIISSEGTATTDKNFNPEVIDQFLRICSELPAGELKKVIPKIKEENWVKLMSSFNPYGFEYEKMFKTLYEAGDIDSLIDLAEVVLSVKSKKELEEKTIEFGRRKIPINIDNPFYFKDFSYVEVFDYLAKIDNEKYIEKAFGIVVKITKKVIKVIELKKEKDKDSVFSVNDNLLLLDEDFFNIDLKKRSISPRENIANLAAVMKILAERFVTKYCQFSPKKVKKFFNRYIGTFDNPKAPLPDSRATWRFRLFVLSLCPQVFKEELKNAFSQLFEVMESKESYYEIESGTEYKKALKKSFDVLNSKYQREYVKNVFKYFGRSFEDRQEEQQHKRDGWQILSSICNCLTKKEREKCEKIFGRKCNPNFEPKPLIGEIRTGFVSPRGEISQEEFHNRRPIDEIVKLLKTEWTPENLQKKIRKMIFSDPSMQRALVSS